MNKQSNLFNKMPEQPMVHARNSVARSEYL